MTEQGGSRAEAPIMDDPVPNPMFPNGSCAICGAETRHVVAATWERLCTGCQETTMLNDSESSGAEAEAEFYRREAELLGREVYA